jgi:hypothetical protein
MGVGGQDTPCQFCCRVRDSVPIFSRLIKPQGRSGVRKIPLVPGFEPWTDQHVASSYTRYSADPYKIVCLYPPPPKY